MGDKGKSKDQGKTTPRAGKPGLRPHEQRDAASKKPEGASGGTG